MTVSNAAIGDRLRRLADLLEIEGANTFRVRAYRDAAQTVTDLPQSVSSMLAAGEDLTGLPGIGEDLAGKLREIVETGRLALLEEVERRTPEGLAELLTVPGLGPKRVRALHDALGITDRAGLTAAAKAGRIRALPGFGAKTEDTIRRALERGGVGERRFKLADIEPVAEALAEHLRGASGVGEVVVAGSYRRRRETVGDLDVVATCAAPDSDVMDRFVGFDEVEEVLGRGPTRGTVRLRSGLQVDLRVVPGESFGAALHYFTGSRAHSVALRGVAQDRGLKINEYGIFRGGERIAGRTEAEF
ncbi:MAG TPA: helix-hairpin-helix domain-containing protein, partial [Geminicoccaceae bacterium]|nr:helix-hairpin-helix domain-containing protein [Geminicoccaceae bacterium]